MQPIYKIFSDNGSMSRTTHLKSGPHGVDLYQDGYFGAESEARKALDAIAEVHRLEGRKVYFGKLVSLPAGIDWVNCIDNLLVVDKVDREWGWWIQRIMPNHTSKPPIGEAFAELREFVVDREIEFGGKQ
jgi:hypothetical protein